MAVTTKKVDIQFLIDLLTPFFPEHDIVDFFQTKRADEFRVVVEKKAKGTDETD